MTAPMQEATSNEVRLPFSVEAVLEILTGSVVLDQSAPSPNAKSQSMASLVRSLNRLQQIEREWNGGSLEQEYARFQRIHTAIMTLRELLPDHLVSYAEDVHMSRLAVEEYGAGDYGMIAHAQRMLDAAHALEAAVSRAFELGIPAPSAFSSMTPDFGYGRRPDNRWRGFAKSIERIFHACLPGNSLQAGYRFVAAVVPHITGENPTPGNVKNCLVTKGDVAAKATH